MEINDLREFARSAFAQNRTLFTQELPARSDPPVVRLAAPADPYFKEQARERRTIEQYHSDMGMQVLKWNAVLRCLKWNTKRCAGYCHCLW
jgi:hypothetical protein